MTKQSRKDELDFIGAAGCGDTDTVKALLKKGINVHAQDSGGRCAIVAAAYNNQLEAVDLLIEAGADVNMKDDTLQSAFLLSTTEGTDGYLELLRKTLEAGADVHSTDSYNGTGLIRAADRGFVEIVRELLKTDIRVNHINKIGWTALHEAVILGSGDECHTQIVQMLVDAGADVSLPDKEGITALEHAKSRGYAGVVKILEQAPAVDET